MCFPSRWARSICAGSAVEKKFWVCDQTSSSDILKACGIDETRRMNDLTEDELNKIRSEIDSDKYTIEGDLRRETALNIKRLIDMNSYRGLRHRKNLPARGQRTRTNARTRKGPAKPIAGKKAAPKK